MTHKLAVITGASSGIGEAFARRLASDGYDLLLVARRKDRLKKLAGHLEENCKNKAEVYVADLSKPEEVAVLARELKTRQTDLLVNNAGFGIGKPFLEIDPVDSHKMIQLHCNAAMDLMQAVLPAMIARGSGSVINVASLAGLIPVPGSAVYPATKSFLVSLTKSVKASIEAPGVRFQALCPGYTVSEFHDLAYPDSGAFKRKSILWLSSEEVVRRSLKDLARNKTVSIPGWINKLIVFAVGIPLIARIVNGVVRKKKKISNK